MLYLRMLITLFVSLYSARILLQELGAEGVGVYNVVAGIILMLSFLNTSMGVSTRRFLNYEMGKKDDAELKKVFANALSTHLIIGLCSIILLESIGLWLIYYVLNIPSYLHAAAVLVYQTSVLAFLIGIIGAPFHSAILAHEKMGLYAYTSILDAFLTLAMVASLTYIPSVSAKFQAYGVLILIKGVINFSIYSIYCVKKFQECRFRLSFDVERIKHLLSFSGWMLFGCISSALSVHGVNVLINVFFSPVFNAARAIGAQVHNVLLSFSTNILTASAPQITQHYAAGKQDGMYKLIFFTSRLSFYLQLILIIPLLLNTEVILDLWLKDPPPLSDLFIRLILIDTLIQSAYAPIAQVNQASGKVMYYQIGISAVFTFVFAATYFSYRWGAPVYFTYIISIASSIIGLLLRLYILKTINQFPVKRYMKQAIIPLIPVTAVAFLVPTAYTLYFDSSLIHFIINTALGFISCIAAIYCIGISHEEKNLIHLKVKSYVRNIS